MITIVTLQKYSYCIELLFNSEKTLIILRNEVDYFCILIVTLFLNIAPIQLKMKKLLFFSTFIIVFSSAIILNLSELPGNTTALFSGSGNCVTCHSAAPGVLQDASGKDVSPHKWWRSTMMANAAKDPLWQAKVSAEVHDHPGLQAIIEDKCNTCHAPMGRTEAHFQGHDQFSFDSAMSDPMSLDGVSCTVCHQVSGDNLGDLSSYSGGYQITDARIIYGPYENPFLSPMVNQVNYTPAYGVHMHSSGLCATCHTLFTPFVDDEMNIGGYFPEQTPYLEWLNSKYPAEQVSCQTCHMPVIEENMKISSRPPNLSVTRDRVWEHEFAGGNVYMSKLLKAHGSQLGINASVSESDSTIQRTLKMLSNAVDLEVDHKIDDSQGPGDQIMVVKVRLQNLTGHKFPTGFPSRRSWLHLKIYDSGDRLVFESGGYDDHGRIINMNEPYLEHFQNITSPSQVQIYQALMQDVNQELTYTLLRGASYLKDNRIMPVGYVSGQNDTATAAAGSVIDDPDFNRDEAGIEGTGADIVYFEIPLSGIYDGFTYDISTFARYEIDVCYQSLDPAFADDLFDYGTSKTEIFRTMYDAVDNMPEVIASASGEYLKAGFNDQLAMNHVSVFPNPASDHMVITFNLGKLQQVRISLVGLNGQEMVEIANRDFPGGMHALQFDLSQHDIHAGQYVLRLRGLAFEKSVPVILTD